MRPWLLIDLTHRALMGGGQAIMIDPATGRYWAPPIHGKTGWLWAT